MQNVKGNDQPPIFAVFIFYSLLLPDLTYQSPTSQHCLDRKGNQVAVKVTYQEIGKEELSARDAHGRFSNGEPLFCLNLTRGKNGRKSSILDDAWILGAEWNAPCDWWPVRLVGYELRTQEMRQNYVQCGFV